MGRGVSWHTVLDGRPEMEMPIWKCSGQKRNAPVLVIKEARRKQERTVRHMCQQYIVRLQEYYVASWKSHEGRT